MPDYEYRETGTESLRRNRRRELLARQIADRRYGSDDVEIDPPDEDVDWVDGGYWVPARIFVPFEDVEDAIALPAEA